MGKGVPHIYKKKKKVKKKMYKKIYKKIKKKKKVTDQLLVLERDTICVEFLLKEKQLSFLLKVGVGYKSKKN